MIDRPDGGDGHSDARPTVRAISPGALRRVDAVPTGDGAAGRQLCAGDCVDVA